MEKKIGLFDLKRGDTVISNGDNYSLKRIFKKVMPRYGMCDIVEIRHPKTLKVQHFLINWEVIKSDQGYVITSNKI